MAYNSLLFKEQQKICALAILYASLFEVLPRLLTILGAAIETARMGAGGLS